jgi:hypothetical protein
MENYLMANPDTPFGLRPTKHLNGHPWNGQAMRCYVTATNDDVLFLGDPMKLTGTACADGCCPSVEVCTAGATSTPQPWLGALVGVEPSTTVSIPKLEATTEGYVNVTADPYLLYEIQGDTGTVIARTDVGSNSVFVAGAGSAITYLSGFELDSSGILIDGSLQMLIWGAVKRSDNDISLEHAKWLVLNSMHHFNSFGLEATPTGTANVMGILGQ